MDMRAQFQKMLEQARKRVPEITAAQASERAASAPAPVILDVREIHEWREGHIPGAVHVPLRGLGPAATEGDPAASEALVTGRSGTVIVYCARGERSLLAADALKRMGYTDVVSMRGGIYDWRREGFEVEVPS